MGKILYIKYLFIYIPFVSAIFIGTLASAAPYASQQVFTYLQPDGSSFQVRLSGDEFFAYEETLDGQVIIFDESTRYYCYAKISNNQLISTGLPVITNLESFTEQESKLKLLNIPLHVRLSDKQFVETLQQRRSEMRVDAKGRTLFPETNLEFKSTREPHNTSLQTHEINGEITGLTILVDFDDEPGTMSMQQVDAFCNSESYTEFENAMSVRSYFLEQSNAKLDYKNIVTAYVRMPKPKSYYDDNTANAWNDSKAQELVSTALELLVQQNFDFSQISTTIIGSRKYIRAINVFFAGGVSSGWNRGLWPHSWSIPAKLIDAGNQIYAYRYQLTNMGEELSIGTFCHESGHLVCEFPDLYAYNSNSVDLWQYSLISSGNHGGKQKHPTNIDPYLKHKAGWINYIDITSYPYECEFNYDKQQVYKVAHPNVESQYYLIEFRHHYGVEGPTGGSVLKVNPTNGIVIYQVNENGSNTYSTITDNGESSFNIPYEIFIIEASTSEKVVSWYLNPIPYSDDGFNSMQGPAYLSKSTLPDISFWTDEGRTEGADFTLHNFSHYGPTMTCIVDSLYHILKTGSTTSMGQVIPQGPIRVADGDSVSFSFIPNAGHSLIDVLVDGVSVGDITSYKLENIVASHTIEPVFAADISDNPTIHSDGFYMYPNPTDAMLNIHSTASASNSTLVCIYSLTGQLLVRKSFQDSQTTVDLADMLPGTYIVNLSNGSFTTTEKLVVR